MLDVCLDSAVLRRVTSAQLSRLPSGGRSRGASTLDSGRPPGSLRPELPSTPKSATINNQKSSDLKRSTYAVRPLGADGRTTLLHARKGLFQD